MKSGISIGEVAREAGCSVSAVRYYEQIGLLPTAGRRSGGHRVYGLADLKRLTFVRRCRDFGFTAKQVKELLDVARAGTPCSEARDIAASQLGCVRSELADIQALEASLTDFVASCSSTCASGTVENCALFEDLGDGTIESRCC